MVAGQARSALTGRSLTAALSLSLLLLVVGKGDAAQQGQDTSVCVGTKPDKCDVVDNGVVQVRASSCLPLCNVQPSALSNISVPVVILLCTWILSE